MWSMKSAAALAVSLWAFMLFYLAYQLFSMHGRPVEEHDPRVTEKLLAALDTLNDLRTQNRELKDLIEAERREHAAINKEDRIARSRLVEQLREAAVGEKQATKAIAQIQEPIEGKPSFSSSHNEGFSKDHEEARRRLDSEIWEIFYFLHKQLKENDGKITNFLRNHTENQIISLLGTSAQLAGQDEKWRIAELKNLTKHIQSKIDKIQNPEKCGEAKTLVCVLDKECGFGCQLHHVAYCFVTAFGAGRMMVLKEDGQRWRYSPKGWTSAFLPITKCSYSDAIAGDSGVPFASHSTARVVNLGIVDGLSDRPEHLPLSFPKSLAEPLQKLHSNPPAFFISQFIWYLMRSSPALGKVIETASSHIPFGKELVVGLQVRRTDKVGTEAAFHAIDEYMEWAEIWFQVQERKLGKEINRTVYIASDDPNVVPETRKKYPNYTVYGDVNIANTAQVASRYTDASLAGVVTDIRLLSQCDYIVCTFSSQVCRMGYELMQVLRGDAGENFHSLDDLYYYGGQFPHEQVALENHTPENGNEIDLKVGDVIGVAGNHWDGYSKGNNRRTGKTGLYPSYKTAEKWRIVNFPALDD